MSLTILQPGFGTTVQDSGRTGFRQLGVSPGGAADAFGARVANLLVGNPEDLAVLEVTLGGVRMAFDDSRIVAWCGGDFSVKVDGVSVPPGRPCRVMAGEELSFGGAKSGCRAWVAVSGGVDVPPVLGCRSTDLRGGFGGFKGRTLRAGDALPLGGNSPMAEHLLEKLARKRVPSWGAPFEWSAPGRGRAVLHFVRGSNWSRFEDSAFAAFIREPFSVSPDSDRMGVRFDGPLMERSDGGGDLVSEAVVPGTIQVPPGGKPILLLADCQTIGGYPKLAHVITTDFPIAAQIRPGDPVWFREISFSASHRLLLERERDLQMFRTGFKLHAHAAN